MDIRTLDPDLVASPQILPDDMQRIAAEGYRSVISNRPDGEAPDQPATADLRRAAEAAGLQFAHVPVVGGQIGDDDVTAFQQALDDLPKPIFGFCRTGTRTTTLWALAHASDTDADSLISTAKTAGYDLSGLRSRLEGAST